MRKLGTICGCAAALAAGVTTFDAEAVLGRVDIDVADVAGVSAATVSRVMNGSRLIGEEARRKVLRAARELGYAPRRVRRQRERSILNVKLILPRHESGLKRLFYDFT